METVVINKRESKSSPGMGIVSITTIGRNPRGTTVMEFERTFLIKKGRIRKLRKFKLCGVLSFPRVNCESQRAKAVRRLNRQSKTERQMKPLRSMLFVPGNRLHLIEKAYFLPSDAIVLDLEDSVPSNEKAVARESVRQHVPKMRSIGVEVYVRINSLSTKFVEEDLRAVVSLELAAIVVPKVQSAQEAQSIAALLKELKRTAVQTERR